MKLFRLNGDLIGEGSSIREIAENNKYNLSHAYLAYADLFRANLSHADLSHADLSHAYLAYADLAYADLSHAYLAYADLFRTNLSHAILSHAKNLYDAYLAYADLSHAILPNYKICPEEGQFIAFKKGRNSEIIKLLIPEDAKRNSCLISRKCRSSKAIVISITKDGKELDSCECWNKAYDLVYKVGETIYPDSYNKDIRTDCSHGIHFFITREEAERW